MKKTALLVGVLVPLLAAGESRKERMDGSSEALPLAPATQSREGFIRLHSEAGRVFLDISPHGLGRYFHLQVYNTEPVDTLAWKNQPAYGDAFRFEQMDSSLALIRWNVRLEDAEDEESPPEELVRSFPILSQDPATGIYRIDPSDFFLNPPERYRWQWWSVPVVGIDENASVLGPVSASEHSFTIQATHTYIHQPEGVATPDTLAVHVAYRALFWPERAAEPRPCDPGMSLWARPPQPGEADSECILYRLPLVPAAPDQWPSDPVTPFVFYVDPDTPERWVPWVIRGVEMWEPVFRAAGFSNAIEARVAPSAGEDPGFDFYDVDHAVYWNPWGNGAWGFYRIDYRSGQILRSAVEMGGGFARALEFAYWTEAAGSDPDLRQLPLPDTILGPALAGIIAHEVGHTLSLPHNHVASGTVPVDSLRSRSFTCEQGLAPTVMDYTPQNYVAQPGDGACTLNRRMGAWDYEVIQWLYGRVDPSLAAEERPGAATPLHWIPGSQFDVRSSWYALGDDAIGATLLGLENIRRLAPLVSRYTDEDLIRPGEPDNGGETFGLSTMRGVHGLFGRLVLTWERELAHVVGLVGGFIEERSPVGLEMTRTDVPEERQAEAVRFLVEHAYSPPEFFLTAELEAALPEPPSVVVAQAQRRLLRSLLSDDRLEQVANGSMVAKDPYGVEHLLGDLVDGLFSPKEDSQISSSELGLRVQTELVERLLEIHAAPGPDAPRLKETVNYQLAFLAGRLASLAAEASSTVLASHYRRLAALIDAERSEESSFKRPMPESRSTTRPGRDHRNGRASTNRRAI